MKMFKLFSRLTVYRLLATLLLSSTLFFSRSSSIQAQLPEYDVTTDGPIQNFAIPERMTNYQEATSGESLAYYIVFIWRSLIFVAGLMVVVYFVIAAFDWISAQGEASKIAAARNKMTGAVAGFIVLAAMFIILELISSIFGLNILQPTLPTTGSTIPTGTSL